VKNVRHHPHRSQPRCTDTQTDGLSISKYGRHWAVYDADGTLVVVAVYRKGALEVVRRLRALAQSCPVPCTYIGKEEHEQS
jgi:hypothetical protein